MFVRRVAIMTGLLGAMLPYPYFYAAADPANLGSATRSQVASPEEAAKNQIEQFVSSLDEFASTPGFGKVVVDYANRSLKVLWKGIPPDSLLSLQGMATAQGLTMTVIPAEYSFAELDAAGIKLLDQDPGGVDVTSTMPNSDFSGLAVSIASDDSSTRREATTLRSLFAEVPITRVTTGGGVGQWTRQNDSAPWQGGGAMTSAAGYCSTGFSVLTSGGGGRLLSASHCDPGGQVNLFDGQGDLLSNGGADVDVQYTNDTMLIDPVNGTIGEVFGGPWNAGTGHNRYEFQVVAKSLPAEGTPVCTSGANTGEHCAAVIHRTGVNRDCGPGLNYNCHGFIVRHTSGGVVGGPGDSGGPVYYDRGDGTVGARGILIGPTIDANGNQTYKVNCPASTATGLDQDAGCGSRGFVIGYHTLESAWGVTIEFE